MAVYIVDQDTYLLTPQCRLGYIFTCSLFIHSQFYHAYIFFSVFRPSPTFRSPSLSGFLSSPSLPSPLVPRRPKRAAHCRSGFSFIYFLRTFTGLSSLIFFFNPYFISFFFLFLCHWIFLVSVFHFFSSIGIFLFHFRYVISCYLFLFIQVGFNYICFYFLISLIPLFLSLRYFYTRLFVRFISFVFFRNIFTGTSRV